MTITIPNALANSIVVALGRTIAMTKVEKNRNAIKCDAAEFIRLLPANYQESCDWLLNETVKVWSEPKFSGDSERQATDSASASWNDSSNAMVGP